MISEKTVELNLTTELVNWLYFMTKVRPYILAPSQREEGTLGFDAEVGFPDSGTPILLQYKRAEYRSGTNEYVYHLNHNATRDQHLRLYVLELLGWNVYYALPLFHLANEVIDKRQHLLPITLYLKPSSMIPLTGMIGHHDVRYNRNTEIITIHSNEGKEITEIYEIEDIVELFEQTETNQDLSYFLRKFNDVFANKISYNNDIQEIEPVGENDYSLYNGMAIIVK